MGRRLRRSLLPILLLASAGCALPPPSPPVSILAPPAKGAEAPRRYRKVAVLPFPEGTEYPRASGEWFAHALAEGGLLEVVPPGRAEVLLRDARLSWPAAGPRGDAWRRAASVLGAEALVLGEVGRTGGFLLGPFGTSVRVVDGGTGEVVHEGTERGGAGMGFSDYVFWKDAVAGAARKLRERLTGDAPRDAGGAGTPREGEAR